MKKATGILLLALLLALALGVTARAEDETGSFIPFPGETWILTNTGTEEASLRINKMDYVITDADGMVTDRDMDSTRSVTIPAGGQAIVHYVAVNSSSIYAEDLPAGVTAVRSETPRLLRADLSYGETCEFQNITDHTANILVGSCCYFLYNSDGTVKEEVFNSSSSSTVLSVPAGGRAVFTTCREPKDSSALANNTETHCMSRAENFILTYDVPLDWTFGCLGINETAAFTNISDQTQTVTCTGGYALYYAGGEGAKLKETGNWVVDVPPGYSVALGCRMYDRLSFASYRFRTDAFQKADLPGPVRYRLDSDGETTWINVSEHKAPVFGITEDMAETQFPEKIAVYANGARMNVVEATEDGDGIYIPKGGRLVVTKGWSSWNIRTLSGQFAVTGDKPVTEGDYVSLRTGQLLTVRHPADYSGVKISGEDYYGIYFSRLEDGELTDVYESAGATFFQLPKDCTWSLSDGSMMERVSLSKGETWAFTARPDAESLVNGFRLPLQGQFLETTNTGGTWDSSPIRLLSGGNYLSLSPNQGRDRTVLTALEDGCRIWYNRLDVEAEQLDQSPVTVEVIPRGKSRVYQFLPWDPALASVRGSSDMEVFGLNVRHQEYEPYQGRWDEKIYTASQSLVIFQMAGIYGRAPLMVSSDDADVIVAYVTENVVASDQLLWPAGLRLLGGGEEVAAPGAAAFDTAELTLLTDRTEPLTLILAAYDEAGKQLSTAQRPVTAAELKEEGPLKLSIPFSCGTDAAKVRLMTVDAQFRPLTQAVTLAGE